MFFMNTLYIFQRFSVFFRPQPYNFTKILSDPFIMLTLKSNNTLIQLK
jgi:uncharacterized protein (DUF486 family)